MVILGDFNVDYKNKKSPNYKKVKFFEKANSLDQIISTTTCNTKTSNSLLDIAFTNMKHIRSAGTLDSFLSDHQPIYILKKKESNGGKTDQLFEGRSYRHYDRQTFFNNIKEANWDSFYEASDPTLAWEIMQNNIILEADKMCPIKQFKIKNTKPCRVTNELIECMRDRDYLYSKAKRTNNEDDWNIAKFHRNRVNANVRRARAEFIQDQLRNSEGNLAKFWRTIKQVMPNKKGAKKHSKISITDEDNVSFNNNLVADHLNEFFANIGQRDKPLNRTANCTPEVLSQLWKGETDGSFNTDIISLQETKALVDKINISKFSGITLLSSKLLKDRQQLVGRLLRGCRFLCTYVLYIHTLYIK